MDKKNRINPLNFMSEGKMPPSETELEEAVLGAMLLEKEAFDVVAEILLPETFYKEQNSVIFKAIKDIKENNQPIDILTVTAELKKQGKLDVAGGAFYIVQLTNRVASAANIEYHARLIAEAYLGRELIRLGSEMSTRAFNNDEDVFELIDDIRKQIDNLGNFGLNEDEMPFSVDIDQRVSEKERMVKDKISITGIPTGNKYLDSITSGFNKGCVYVFAGGPASGKSVKGLNYSKIAALLNYRVCFFSLEMPKKDLIDRLLSEEAKIPLHDYRENKMTDFDVQKMQQAAKTYKKLPISIYDNPSANTNYIRKKIKTCIKRFGNLDMVVIDYAQLLKSNEKHRTREEEVSTAAKEIKVLAKQFDIPIILLAQVGRGIWQVSDRRPNLSHLRESAEIENSADFVGFIYRPSYYFNHKEHPDFKNPDSKISKMDASLYEFHSELIVAKNRAGLPNVNIYERFYGHYSTFTTELNEELSNGQSLQFTEDLDDNIPF